MIFGTIANIGLSSAVPVFDYDYYNEDLELAKILHDNRFGQRIEKRQPNGQFGHIAVESSSGVINPLDISALSGVVFQPNHNQLHVENQHVLSDFKNSSEEVLLISSHENKDKTNKQKRRVSSDESRSSEEDDETSSEDKLHRVPLFSTDGSPTSTASIATATQTNTSSTTSKVSTDSTSGTSRVSTTPTTPTKTSSSKARKDKEENSEREREEELKEKIEEVEAEPVILTQGV